MSYAEHWRRALLAPEPTVPDGLTTWNGSDAGQRFQVYRNNVFASLIDALAETFGVTQALVGEAFFRAMAREYIVQFPPHTASLAHYGHQFPEFIGGFPPARPLPYLADVARVEQAYVAVYHSEDAQPLDMATAQSQLERPDQLAGCRFVLHPAFQVLRSDWAVVSIWAAHQGHGSLDTIDPSSAENAWVIRSGLQVAVLATGRGDCCLVEALQAGESLQAAAGLAFSRDPAFDLTRCLGLLFREGLIVEVVAESG
jgi:hypothetical protein